MASSWFWRFWPPWRRRGDVAIYMDVTPERAREFVTKLAHDDGFRERVEADPREVLAEYDVRIEHGAVPKKPIVLPSREQLEEVLEQMKDGEEPWMPLGYGWILLVLAFAMPLVPGDAPEADAPR